ncbi:MAG: SDR family oxidoreductase, partial [Desulfuromonadales bacterium]|nr:SDR family oxidoreductase [Desulfuromonadales bacterium]
AGGGEGFAVGADLGSLPEISRLFRECDAAFLQRTGKAELDILVNNAGIGLVGTVDQTTEEMFDRQFDINVKGLFFVTQNAAPRLRPGGRIVNLSSLVALRAYPDCAAYAATKGAVNSLTMAFASQFGNRGITVNAVAPGMTATDFVASYMGDENYVQLVKSTTALGRIGASEDIAGVVAALVSRDSGWVTGQTIYATGGMQL